MEASVKRISDIFSSNITLRIPYFQRRYVWDVEEWDRFANDMESTIDSEKLYFLGAIILKEESDLQDKFMVVDGQQRLTTFTLYMKALYMLIGRSFEKYLQDTDIKDPILTHNCEDLPIYTEIMHLETGRQVTSSNKIANAYLYFFDILLKARKERGVNLDELRRSIEKKVSSVAIILQQGDDEQQIFDTINSLGVPLTTGELMKNFLYRADDEKVYNKTWKTVFDTEKASKFWDLDRAKIKQEKGAKNSNIEVFFHAFVRIKMWDFVDRLTISQRKSFVKSSNVFSTCKSFVDNFGMDRLELAEEILSYAKLFKDNFSTEILEERIPRYSGIKRIACLINATKSNAAIPYILYVLKNVAEESERNKIFGYIETYMIRRILADSKNNSYSEFFSESLICNKLLKFDDLKDFISNKDDSANLAMPSNVSVLSYTTTREKNLEENMARVILYMYESKIERSKDDAPILGFNDYVAEQLMPKPISGNNNWLRADTQEAEDDRKMKIGTIGNYYLMNEKGKKELKKVHNESFANKIPVMKTWGSGIRSNTNITDERNSIIDWTADTINARSKGLANALCEIYSI